MSEPKLEARLEDTASLYYAEPPFDAALRNFEKIKATLLYPQELGYARTKVPREHSLYQGGSIINLGILIVPKVTYRKILIMNPLDNLADGYSAQVAEVEKAVAAHKEGAPFAPADDFVQKYLDLAHAKYSVDETVFPMLPEDAKPIITKRFLHARLAVWLFKKKTSDIGDYLHESGIRQVYFHNYSDWWIDINRKVFFNFIYMGGAAEDFQLIGHARLHQTASRGLGGGFKDKTEYRNYLKEKKNQVLEAAVSGDGVALRAEHAGKTLVFKHPYFGPAPFWEIEAQLKAQKLLWPTFAELLSLVYAAWNHPLYAEEFKKVLRAGCLAGSTGILYTANHGGFVQDRLTFEDKWIPMKSRDLVDRITAGDPAVRRVQLGFLTGRLSCNELARTELMLALAGGAETALKAAELAGVFKNPPSLNSLLGGVSGSVISLPILAADPRGEGLTIICDNPNINRPICTYGVMKG